jgi:hypothetical protein
MSSANGVLALTSPPSLAVALAECLERDEPVVEFLTADPERMLWRLVRDRRQSRRSTS